MTNLVVLVHRSPANSLRSLSIIAFWVNISFPTIFSTKPRKSLLFGFEGFDAPKIAHKFLHLPQNPHVLIINEGMKPVLTGSCQLQVKPEPLVTTLTGRWSRTWWTNWRYSCYDLLIIYSPFCMSAWAENGFLGETRFLCVTTSEANRSCWRGFGWIAAQPPNCR